MSGLDIFWWAFGIFFGVLTWVVFVVVRQERRKEEAFMLNAQVIDGIFLPAPADERWLYDESERDIVLESIKIHDVINGGFALIIEDKRIEVAPNYGELHTGGLGAYCSQTFLYQKTRGRQINYERKLAEVAKASEKHVGLIDS